MNAVRRLTRGMRLAAQNTQSASGISAAQLFVLRFLSDGEPHSIRDLAELTMTDRSSVAAVVERLVARGLADRGQSRQDRRRAEVRITSAGLYLLDAAPFAPTELLMHALAGMSDEKLNWLAESLEELVERMGLEGMVPGLLFEEDVQRSRPVTR